MRRRRRIRLRHCSHRLERLKRLKLEIVADAQTPAQRVTATCRPLQVDRTAQRILAPHAEEQLQRLRRTAAGGAIVRRRRHLGQTRCGDGVGLLVLPLGLGQRVRVAVHGGCDQLTGVIDLRGHIKWTRGLVVDCH